MEEVEDKFREVVDKILADGPEKFDLERIQTIVRQMLLARRGAVENGPLRARALSRRPHEPSHDSHSGGGKFFWGGARRAGW